MLAYENNLISGTLANRPTASFITQDQFYLATDYIFGTGSLFYSDGLAWYPCYTPTSSYSISSSYAATSSLNISTALYATSAGYAGNAGSSNYSTSGGYAGSAGASNYATTAGYSSNGNFASGSFYANNAGSANYATSAGYAGNAGSSNYSISGGYALSASYSSTANFASGAFYSNNAGSANYAITSGYTSTANFASGAYFANNSYFSNTSTSASYASLANFASGAFYANNAGSSNYALSAATASYVANVVDTITNQTINGNKTFNGSVYLQGFLLYVGNSSSILLNSGNMINAAGDNTFNWNTYQLSGSQPWTLSTTGSSNNDIVTYGQVVNQLISGAVFTYGNQNIGGSKEFAGTIYADGFIGTSSPGNNSSIHMQACQLLDQAGNASIDWEAHLLTGSSAWSMATTGSSNNNLVTYAQLNAITSSTISASYASTASYLSGTVTSASYATTASYIITSSYSANSIFQPSFRNRLFNGEMKVDQRNNGVSQIIPTTTSSYTVDRWYASASGASLTGSQAASFLGNYIYVYSLTGTTGNTGFIFGQKIESYHIYDAAVDSNSYLSAWISSTSLTNVSWSMYYCSVQDNWTTKTKFASGSWTINATAARYTASVVLPNGANQSTNGVAIEFSGGALTATNTIKFTGIQFESNQLTSFEYLPIPTVQNICYRYYYQTTEAFVLGGVATSSLNKYYQFYKFPTSMRTQPNVSSVFSGLSNVTNSIVTNVGISGFTAVISSSAAGQFLATYNSTNSASAEL